MKKIIHKSFERDDDMTGFKNMSQAFLLNNADNRIQKTSTNFFGQNNFTGTSVFFLGTFKFFTEFLLMKFFPLLFHLHSF